MGIIIAVIEPQLFSCPWSNSIYSTVAGPSLFIPTFPHPFRNSLWYLLKTLSIFLECVKPVVF